MPKAKYNANDVARDIADTASRLGWTIDVHDGILTIVKRFPKEDREAFVDCDCEYYSILGRLPATRAGSTWGTDGGGIGALSAMKHGVFRMNKSGGAKRVLTALAKLA